MTSIRSTFSLLTYNRRPVSEYDPTFDIIFLGDSGNAPVSGEPAKLEEIQQANTVAIAVGVVVAVVVIAIVVAFVASPRLRRVVLPFSERRGPGDSPQEEPDNSLLDTPDDSKPKRTTSTGAWQASKAPRKPSNVADGVS